MCEVLAPAPLFGMAQARFPIWLDWGHSCGHKKAKSAWPVVAQDM